MILGVLIYLRNKVYSLMISTVYRGVPKILLNSSKIRIIINSPLDGVGVTGLLIARSNGEFLEILADCYNDCEQD